MEDSLSHLDNLLVNIKRKGECLLRRLDITGKKEFSSQANNKTSMH